MTKIKYIVSYTDSKGKRQSKTTDTYIGARKVADYIKEKGGEARVSIFFDKSVKSVWRNPCELSLRFQVASQEDWREKLNE